MPTVESSTTPKVGKVAGRYSTLEAKRMPYLRRGWECAELTVPSLLPRDGTNSTTELPIPWQTIGARGTHNLSSKLLMSTLPTNTAFFRQGIEEFVIEKMAEDTGEEPEVLKAQFEQALGKVERSTMSYIGSSTDRVSIEQAFKHLIVVGNVLLFKDPKKGMKVFTLNHYVVRRDRSGNVMEIIIKECVDPSLLPEVLRMKTTLDPQMKDSVDLYTMISRNQKDGHWDVWQEAVGEEVPGTRTTRPLDKPYWLPLRFVKIDGESYGRSYVENMLGDLRSLEALQQAIVEGSAAAAKVLFLVKPNGTTKVSVLAKAPNGAIVNGNAEEVTALHLDKAQDFQIAMQLWTNLKQELSLSFLLNSSIQRDAERVTAEEIRYMAQELEQSLGGFYTVLSVEFQIPYVQMVQAEMQSKGMLPPLPKGKVKLTITTGFEALGRGQELAKLNTWIQGIISTWGPEVAAQRLDVGAIEAKRALALGIDVKGLIKSNEQLQAEAAQSQQSSLGEKVAPNMVNAAGKMIQEGMKQNAGTGQAASQAA